jgi:hypothetical protein
MSATHTAVPSAATTTTGSLVGTGLAAAALASVATAIVAAAGNAAGISLEVGGAPIPVPGFAVMTAIFSLVGLVLAAVLSRTAHHPRSTFVRTTVVLTALSFVPDLTADAAPATKALLMLTHLVAAAIVIPAVARRLGA